MSRLNPFIVVLLSLLLTACQNPPPSSSSSGGGASGGGASGGGASGGGASGGGASGGGASGGGASGGGASGGGGMPSGGMPGGSSGDSSSGSGSDSGSGDSTAESGGADQGASGGSSSGGSSNGSSGSGESVGDLDEQLDESLEDFDSSVGGAGKGDKPVIDILGGGGSGVPSDEPLFEEGDLAGEGAVAEDSEIAERAGEGPGGTTPTTGDGSGQSTGEGHIGGPGESGEVAAIPEDIDDGRGDDIVLRQIRDAAMREKDPKLREKLWDEYRRIKNARK